MTRNAADPRLSVVVALISGKKGDLERCLQALSSQRGAPDFEILVPWDDAAREVAELASHFPNARFLHANGLDTRAARAGASREHHDTLRTLGLRAARGSIVALTEDHAVATPTWCADMMAALDAHPRAAAVGGAVECGATSLLGRAVYYCDFGRYENPLPEGPAQYVSDSNVAYRRSALEAIADAWADDYHETVVHGALVACGFDIVLTRKSEVAQVRTGLSFGEALRERFVWGRSYAGTRVAGAPLTQRAVFAAMTVLLPFLLTWRLLRGKLARKRDLGRFLACLPLVFLLQVGWALGELIGYATGDPGKVR
ncbi:MAG: glycosyltransferase [Planctomycetota bacterium]